MNDAYSILLVVVLAVGLLLYFVNRRFSFIDRDPVAGYASGRREEKKDDAPVGCEDSGCGLKTVCSRKDNQPTPEDYYDDEELDSYKGRAADDYTESEVNEFGEVLATLRKEEVTPWLNSLCTRGINLPRQLQHAAIEMAHQKENKI